MKNNIGKGSLLGALLLSLASLAWPGCTDADNGHGPADDAGVGTDLGDSAACGAGLQAVGKACEPIFEDCGDDEVSLLGGGCKPIGIQQCSGGLSLPASAACEPVGVPLPCPAGWQEGDDGACEPILPAEPCGGAEIALIGQTRCQPLRACGSGTYGDLATTSATLFVNSAYTGQDSDGSQSRPYTTIAAALAAAPPGGHVAIAAGTYAEDIEVTRPVTIEGRCPELVTIQGQGKNEFSAIEIYAGPTAVKGLTLTGPAEGLSTSGAEALVEEVAVASCDSIGLVAASGGQLTLRRTTVTESRAYGLLVEEAAAELDRAVIQKTRVAFDGNQGPGVVIWGGQRRAELVARDSLVRENIGSGVFFSGASSGDLERLVIAATIPHPTKNTPGTGLTVYNEGRFASDVTIRRSLVTDNTGMSVDLRGSTLALEETTLRRTLPLERGAETVSLGINANNDEEAEASFSAHRCLISEHSTMGVTSSASEALILRSVLKSNGAGAQENTMNGGAGVASIGEATAKMELVRSILEDNGGVGLACRGAVLSVKETLVARSRPLSEVAGIGVLSLSDGRSASLLVEDSSVIENPMLGILMGGSEGTIRRTLIAKTAPTSEDLELGYGVAAKMHMNLPSKLSMDESVIRDTQLAGLHLADSDGLVQRSVIRRTAPAQTDLEWGFGVSAISLERDESSLRLEECIIAESRMMGVLAAMKAVEVVRTRVVDIAPHATNEHDYGDGIVAVFGATVSLEDSLVMSAHRAGALFFEGSGFISRSVFRANKMAIALERDGVLEKNEDNAFIGNQEDGVVSAQGLSLAAPPALPDLQ